MSSTNNMTSSEEARKQLREHSASTAEITRKYLEAGGVATELYRRLVCALVREKFPNNKITVRKLCGAVDSRDQGSFEKKLEAAAKHAEKFGEITIDPDSLTVRFFAK